MLSQDFKELLALFNENKVEYLIVGGYALAIHGHPRYTGDLDIWVLSKTDNAERILKSLHAFGLESLQFQSEDFSTPNQVVQLGNPPLRVDLMTNIDGVDFDEAWKRRKMIELEGLLIPFISKVDLIANKKVTGRYQDLADVEKLILLEEEK